MAVHTTEVFIMEHYTCEIIARHLVREHFNVEANAMQSHELATFFRYLPDGFLASQDARRQEAIKLYQASLS